MRKRKISLVLILAFALFTLLFIYGGSFLVAQKIEAEVDKLFPEIATKSRVEGLEFSYREGIQIENFYVEMLTEDKKNSATGKDIRASLNWAGFIFSGGKLRINSLYMSSFSIRISKTFQSVLDHEVENIINQTVRNILKRESISKDFSLRIDEFYIVDANEKVMRVNPIQFSRKGNRELQLFISEAGIDTLTAFRFLRLHMNDYSFSDSLTSILQEFDQKLILDSLQNVTGLFDQNSKNFFLSKLNKYVEFQSMELGLGIAYFNTDQVDSLFGLDFSIDHRKDTLLFSGTMKDLFSSLDTLHDAALKLRTYDSLVLLDTFNVFSQKGGTYKISGAMMANGRNGILSMDVNGLKSTVARKIYKDFPKGVSGKLSMKGVIQGNLFVPSSWSYKGGAIVEGFKCTSLPFQKKFNKYFYFPVRMDSLVVDSLECSIQKFSADFSRSVIDTDEIVPFRPYPTFSKVSYNHLKKELAFDTISAFSFRYNKYKHTLSAGNITISLDSIDTSKVLLHDCKASSIELSLSEKRLNKSKIDEKFLSSTLTHSGLIDIEKVLISSNKKAIHPDTLGYYYPTLLSGAGIKIEKRGVPDSAIYTVKVDSLVIPKRGRLSRIDLDINLSNTKSPLYRLYLKDLFLHEKSLPFSLSFNENKKDNILRYFPKSKCTIEQLTVQNDTVTLFKTKSLKINYLNDTLYKFSYNTLFQNEKINLIKGSGHLKKKDDSLQIVKATLQNVILYNNEKMLSTLKRYQKGNLNKKLLPLLPLKGVTIARLQLMKRDSLKAKIEKLEVNRLDSSSLSLKCLKATLFEKLSCKWAEAVVQFHNKGNKVSKLDIAQLSLMNTQPVVLKKKGNSFNAQMIDTFKKGFSYLNKYVDKDASIKISSCKGEVDSLGKFSFRNCSIATTSKKDQFSQFKIENITYPGFDKVNSFETGFRQMKDRWIVNELKLVSGDNTRLFASGYLKPINQVPCSLDIRIENFKLSNFQKHYFKKTDARIRGGAYGNLKLQGSLFNRKTWRAKRASATLLNVTVENLPLQKGEKITKYAPTFRKLHFSKIIINPTDLNKNEQIHIKYLEAKSDKLNFTGWGSLDFNGRFYFEMKGRVHKKSADALPRLTRLALNEASKTEYGKFYAKLYGDTKKQYLVPERGIAGKVIRSQFRKIGASFRNLFKHDE